MKLAILGASYLQVPLINKARSIGIETHCFAWDSKESICKKLADYFYPISVIEKEQICAKCAEIKIDGITTIATDICVPTIAYVADKLNLISNSIHSSIISTNKSKMREAFKLSKINSPKSKTLDRFSKPEFDNFNFPLIVKPTDRSGSRGVTKVANCAELEMAIERALTESLEKRVVVEEFIEGIEVSVETISSHGHHYILALTDKETSHAPYFVELEHHQPSLLTDEIQKKIRQETIKSLNALEIKFGASHAEFKITANGDVYVIEVGARMGGDFIGSHLVELSTGYDFLKGVIDVALNKFEIPQITDNNYSGVYFLSEETKYLLKYFNTQDSPDFIVERAKITDELKKITNSNDRSGYLIYKNRERLVLK